MMSQRKQKLIETDDGNDFVNEIFLDSIKDNVLKRYSQCVFKGAVLAEGFIGTFSKSFIKPVF